jgi:hypothetical protein
MKRLWKAMLLPFFLFAFWGNPVLAEEVKGPKIVLKELLFDFGYVKEGKTIEHTFKVFNQGDQTLEIKQVKAG